MNEIRHSLRFKLALTFAIFGTVVSLLLSLGLLFIARDHGERLMDETLRAEIDDYAARRTRNPDSLPPATVSIRGYVLDLAQGQGKTEMPSELLAFGPGKYQLTLKQVPYRLVVADHGSDRYFMLFNEERQRKREKTFLLDLVAGTLIMILVSVGVGWWLAGRIVAPVAELSRRVDRVHPEDEVLDVAQGFPPDEIGRLAQVFDTYVKRMRAFIEREREFTADVSHELRTPLAVMQGVVEIMEDDPELPDRQRERVARIGRANREMVNLTRALLLMARETRPDDAVMQDCDVCEVVAETIEQNRHLLSAQTRVRLDCPEHPLISAEPMLLGIVVANLVRNAFNHTPSGQVSITVTAGSLVVADSGSGIGAEEIGKVFQRHFKGSGSTGSGIGLSLVKRICDRYGWNIVIASADGHGTSARLSFAAPAPIIQS